MRVIFADAHCRITREVRRNEKQKSMVVLAAWITLRDL